MEKTFVLNSAKPQQIIAFEKIKKELSPLSHVNKQICNDIMQGCEDFMGIVKLPKLTDYWSKDEMLGQPFVKKLMSRNRFEILLRMLHFMNNEEANKNDHLSKIGEILDTLNLNFSQDFTSNESICINDSMVPFRGRIIFRQYN